MSVPVSIDALLAASALPGRREDGHKGDFGKLLIVGGAAYYTGAPYLAASAAVHSGCGLVYLGVPQGIWRVEAAKCASAMPFPLSDEGGLLCETSYGGIVEKLQNCNVLALGCGLGRSKSIDRLVARLLDFAPQPIVLDADGINALAGQLDVLDLRRSRTTILTPHEAEFARLLDVPVSKITNGDRPALASAFAVRHACVLVLKRHETVIALPDGDVLVNDLCGSSALSKGGSGDVLTGLIASLLAQGASARDASICGVYLHARAGDLLAERKTAYCVTPDELITQGFPLAFQSLLE